MNENQNQNMIEELMSALKMQDRAEYKQLLTLMQAPELQPLFALQQIQSAIHTMLITDRMPGGFFIYRADGDEELIYCNQALIRLFGCETLEELKALTGYTFPGLVHPDDIEEVERSIQEQIAESRYDLDYVEYRIIQKDGTVRWIEDYGHYIGGEGDGGGLFYVFIADATDKREQQLMEQAASLESVNRELRRRLKIIEGFSLDYESIFYVDLDENQISPYQVSSRVTDTAALGKTVPMDGFHDEYMERWVHPEDREMYAQTVSPDNIRQKLSRSRVFETIYRIVDDGKPVHLQLRVANVGGESDHVSQVVLGYRRVDDELLRELEQRLILEDALKQAHAAVDAKNTFLSNMSHDLRTPMNTVVGYTSLAKNNLDDPEKLKNCLDKIEEYSNRTLRLIGDVLELSRLESGDAQAKETPCDLLAMLHAIQTEALPLAAEKGIDLSLSLMGLQHSAVYCDSERLSQVLLRLVNNAVKYTPAGGQVRVSVTESGAPTRDYAAFRFEVRDNGVGMDPEFLARVFEPFERQQNSTLSGVPGMGLGLTIAKSTVALMGGVLSAESEPDKGSCFTVDLTLRIQEKARESLSPAAAGSGQPRILLVEDNDINRELCAEILQESGFLVETAENGQIAVDMVENSAPGYYALVLMDIQMPVMDGNTAARTIRALPDPALAEIPIVALSANSLPEDRKRSMESGMNAHLPKPIQVDELLSLIQGFSGGPAEK